MSSGGDLSRRWSHTRERTRYRPRRIATARTAQPAIDSDLERSPMRRRQARQELPDQNVAMYRVLFAPDGRVSVSAKWAPGAAFPTRFIFSIGPCALATWVGHKLTGSPRRQAYFDELRSMAVALIDHGSEAAIAEKIVGGHVSDFPSEELPEDAPMLIGWVFQRQDGAMYVDWKSTEGFSAEKLGLTAVASAWSWARSQPGADQSVIDIALFTFAAFYAGGLDDGVGLATREEYLSDGTQFVSGAYDMVKSNPAWVTTDRR
jgi:hypothetical protein